LLRFLTCVFTLAMLAFGAGTATAGPLRTGILDPDASATQNPVLMMHADVASQRVADSGGSLVRLYAYWNRIAPTKPANPRDPSTYSTGWAQLNNQIAAAHAAGLDVMLTLRSAPKWAQGSAGANDEGSYKPSPADFGDFAHAIATRFNGQVKYWGMWNEPNLPHFLRPQYARVHGKRTMVSAGRYRRLLNAGAKAVHAVNPNNVVVAGETAPFGHSTNPAPKTFLRKLLCVSKSGAPTCRTKIEADIWATHPYTSGNPWHHAFSSNDISFGDLGEWQSLVRAAARAGHFVNHGGSVRKSIRFWDTEMSWDTKPPDPEAVPMKLHARWTAEALYRTWAFGIEALIWLQLRDYPHAYSYESGLYFYENSQTQIKKPKLSQRAFRFPFVAYASGGRVKVWGRTPDSDSRAIEIQRKTSAGWTTLKHLHSGSKGIFLSSWSSSDRTHSYRARIQGTTTASVPFSLHRPADRFVNPFGS
jgi:hypothetical protein